MTKDCKQAIDDTIRLWRRIIRTPYAVRFTKRAVCKSMFGKIICSCPLCQYVLQPDGAIECDFCPYYQKFGHCMSGPYSEWTQDPAPRRAKAFLAKLLELKNG